MKRLFDFLLSLTALLILLSPLAVITLLLLIFNKGAGAFFTQTRTGKDAKLFQIITLSEGMKKQLGNYVDTKKVKVVSVWSASDTFKPITKK